MNNHSLLVGAICAGLALSVAACTTILGIDGDYQDRDGGAGATAGGSSSGGGCTAPMAMCGGTCVDITEDQAHCGACDHDCQGQLCTAGECQELNLAATQATPLFLAVDSMYVYWTSDDGIVRSAPVDGGAITVLATGQMSPQGIVADGTFVYWADRDAGTIMKVDPTAPPMPITIVSGQMGPYTVAIIGSFVYWTDTVTDKIMNANVIAGIPTEIASGQLQPSGIATNGIHVSWTNRGDDTVAAFSTTGGIIPLATMQNNPISIAADTNRAYWTNNTGGDIMAATFTNPMPTVLVDGQGSPYGIAVYEDASGSEDAVYWTNNLEGKVMKFSLPDGPVLTLASEQDHPTAVAVDKYHVYWINNVPGGSVRKVAR